MAYRRRIEYTWPVARVRDILLITDTKYERPWQDFMLHSGRIYEDMAFDPALSWKQLPLNVKNDLRSRITQSCDDQGWLWGTLEDRMDAIKWRAYNAHTNIYKALRRRLNKDASPDEAECVERSSGAVRISEIPRIMNVPKEAPPEPLAELGRAAASPGKNASRHRPWELK